MVLIARAPKRIVFQVWYYFKLSDLGKMYELPQRFRGKGVANTVSENAFHFCKDSLQRMSMKKNFKSPLDIAQSTVFFLKFLKEGFMSFGYKEDLDNFEKEGLLTSKVKKIWINRD